MVEREIYVSGAKSSSAATWHLLRIVHTMQPQSEVRVNRWQADVGITDDPTDEALTICLCFCQPEDPKTSNPTPQAFWVTTQRWRSIGTVATVLDVTERFDEDFEEQAEHSNIDRDTSQDFTEDEALCLYSHSNTTSSVAVEGMLYITEFLHQRKFRDARHGNWKGTSLEDVVSTVMGCQ